jgi:hypothetical protein
LYGSVGSTASSRPKFEIISLARRPCGPAITAIRHGSAANGPRNVFFPRHFFQRVVIAKGVRTPASLGTPGVFFCPEIRAESRSASSKTSPLARAPNFPAPVPHTCVATRPERSADRPNKISNRPPRSIVRRQFPSPPAPLARSVRPHQHALPSLHCGRSLPPLYARPFSAGNRRRQGVSGSVDDWFTARQLENGDAVVLFQSNFDYE